MGLSCVLWHGFKLSGILISCVRQVAKTVLQKTHIDHMLKPDVTTILNGER